MNNDTNSILKSLSLSVRNYIETSREFDFIEPEDVHFAISSKNGRNICCLIDKEALLRGMPFYFNFKLVTANLAYALKDAFNADVRVSSEYVIIDIISLDEFETMIQDDQQKVKEMCEEIVAMLEVIEEQLGIDPLEDEIEDDEDPYFT